MSDLVSGFVAGFALYAFGHFLYTQFAGSKSKGGRTGGGVNDDSNTPKQKH